MREKDSREGITERLAEVARIMVTSQAGLLLETATLDRERSSSTLMRSQ